MKAIIVEDKAHIRMGLVHLLNEIDSNISVVGECGSVKDAVIVAKSCKPQLVFLDINLPDGTGFDFLNQTDGIEFKTIFITAYEEYALQALKIGAVDYLLKPVDIEDLKAALDKIKQVSYETHKQYISTAQMAFGDQGNVLVLSLQDSYQVINLEELMYCKSDKGYTTFYMDNGKKHMASKPLKGFEQKLEQCLFARPHQSYMVNLKYLDKYDKSGTIYLKNGTKIPVSFRRKDGFISKLDSSKK